MTGRVLLQPILDILLTNDVDSVRPRSGRFIPELFDPLEGWAGERHGYLRIDLTSFVKSSRHHPRHPLQHPFATNLHNQATGGEVGVVQRVTVPRRP